jgi:general secretion pathway protein E/type IV pilus assembly protein PilB
MMRTLKQAYGLGAETVLQIRQDRALQKRVDKVTYDDFIGQDVSDADEETASIIHLVNQILLEALELQCTDIHLEPYPTTSRLRYRIDGMLRNIPTPPGIRELHEAIVTRLKVMANANIAERRLPHDGRIRVRIGEEKFDLRMSILPTRFGETLCLRILNREAIFREMDQLGFNPTQMAILNDLIDLPHGMILMTGPTGSGKTTTLYAALAKVRDHSPDLKIITVEDPVEYELEGTSQIQVRADIGLTFASGLRSILRHDPDIILIGEIRDSETAEIAIRSALTGHLVLSTLHTNDSVGAINRLVDMGIEPFLVGSSLIAALAQRLVRRICPHCKQPDPAFLPRLRKEMAASLKLKPEEAKAWVGRGCNECDQSGYRGRVAILEVFLLDEAMQDMVSRHAPTIELRAAACARGMRTLRDSGWEKVQAGQTTMKEVTRMTSSLQLSYNPGSAAP